MLRLAVVALCSRPPCAAPARHLATHDGDNRKQQPDQSRRPQQSARPNYDRPPARPSDDRSARPSFDRAARPSSDRPARPSFDRPAPRPSYDRPPRPNNNDRPAFDRRAESPAGGRPYQSSSSSSSSSSSGWKTSPNRQSNSTQWSRGSASAPSRQQRPTLSAESELVPADMIAEDDIDLVDDAGDEEELGLGKVGVAVDEEMTDELDEQEDDLLGDEEEEDDDDASPRIIFDDDDDLGGGGSKTKRAKQVAPAFAKKQAVRSFSAGERRVNEQIDAPKITLIGLDGKRLGDYSVRSAIALARAKDRRYNVVEIEPRASPPVCRIVDPVQQAVSEKRKRLQERKLIEEQTDGKRLKEVRFGSKIAEHDLQIKVRKIQQFLLKQKTVKCSIVFEKDSVDPELANDFIAYIFERIEPIGKKSDIPQTLDRRTKAVAVVFVPKTNITVDDELKKKLNDLNGWVDWNSYESDPEQ